MIDFVRRQSERATAAMQSIETRARKFSLVDLIWSTLQAYADDQCSTIAAALVYYALLSIFPLALFVITMTSAFVSSENVVRNVTAFFSSGMPFSAQLLERSVQEVARARGALTILAAGGFLWSALSIFDMIQRGINRAFRVPRSRPKWRQSIISIAMVAGVGILFAVSFTITTYVRLSAPARFLARGNSGLDIVSHISTLVISVIIFALLYRYIPYDDTLRWRDVWLGAVFAAIAWEIAKVLFAWYLTDYATLNLVYGPLGAVIALMLWSYLTASILLFGAEIVAVRSGAHKRARQGNEWWAITAQ